MHQTTQIAMLVAALAVPTTGAVAISPAAATSAAHAAAARSGKAPCVRAHTYRKITKGLRYPKVVNRTGSKGRDLGDYWGSDGYDYSVAWKACGSSAHYVISFKHTSRPRRQWTVDFKDTVKRLY
ncbi:hypothetical protein BH11ACT8_BH11ACT8_02370 [soil metagenome]